MKSQLEHQRVLTPGCADLIALGSDDNHHLKGLVPAEWHVPNIVLDLPGSIVARVEDHLGPAVEARIEVKGDVAGLGGSTQQVDEEPVVQLTTDRMKTSGRQWYGRGGTSPSHEVGLLCPRIQEGVWMFEKGGTMVKVELL